MDPPQTPDVSLVAHNEAQSLDGSEKRKRQPRNSACQACATLKMKCVPGPVVGRCERLVVRTCSPNRRVTFPVTIFDFWQPGTASVRTRCKLPIARVDDWYHDVVDVRSQGTRYSIELKYRPLRWPLVSLALFDEQQSLFGCCAIRLL